MIKLSKILAIDLTEIFYQSVFVTRSQNKSGKYKLPFFYFILRKLFSVIKNFPNRTVFGLSDGRSSWRKSIYSHYKEKRGDFRASFKDIDWDYSFSVFDILIDHLKKFTPILILQEEQLESDDWASYLSRNGKDVVIASSDADLHQLCYFPITLVSLRDKKFKTKVIKDPLAELEKKIIHGCSTDNVPPVKGDKKQFEINSIIVNLITLPEWVDHLMMNYLLTLDQKQITKEQLEEFTRLYNFKFVKKEINQVFLKKRKDGLGAANS